MIKYYLGILIVGLVVLGAIIYGFNSSGSPAKVRAEKFDLQRVSSLNNLKYSIENYYNTNGRLPVTIDDMYSQSGSNSTNETVDPETKKEYEYIPGKDSYQLCAVFSASTKNSAKQNRDYNAYGDAYDHPKGYYCFDFKVTKPLPAVNNDLKYDASFLCMYIIQDNQYTKIGQTLKTGGDQVVKGIKVKLQFTSGKLGYVTLREITDEKNPESGIEIAKAEIPASFDGNIDRTIYLPKPVTLSQDKAYIFIFESDKESTMYVYYSNYNAAPTATTFMYKYDVTSSLNEQFSWEKFPLSDIYYEII